jgi:hypothetical protein
MVEVWFRLGGGYAEEDRARVLLAEMKEGGLLQSRTQYSLDVVK